SKRSTIVSNPVWPSRPDPNPELSGIPGAVQVDTSTEQSAGAASGGRQIRRRKQWSVQEKLQIVRETLQSEGSVPVIARRHGVNANQIFTWRREYRRGKLLER